jgi:N-acetylated-alpha-linked acidic dipeptidase
MDGIPARDEWKGDLIAPYNLGPKLKNNFTIKMEVYTSNQMRTTYNTIGIIRGEIEPGYSI